MADHDPHLGAQDGEAVRDGLGVGRPHTDVDHRDAVAGLGNEIIARELVRTRRRIQPGVTRPRAVELLAGPALELLGVHGVVGEEDELLHSIAADAGVVLYPLTGDVETLGREVEERLDLSVERVPPAVDNAIINIIQSRGRKSSQLGPLETVDISRRNNDIRVVGAHVTRIIFCESGQHLAEIARNQARTGKNGGINPGLLHVTKRLRPINRLPRIDGHRQSRVANATIRGAITSLNSSMRTVNGLLVHLDELINHIHTSQRTAFPQNEGDNQRDLLHPISPVAEYIIQTAEYSLAG